MLDLEAPLIQKRDEKGELDLQRRWAGNSSICCRVKRAYVAHIGDCQEMAGEGACDKTLVSCWTSEKVKF